MNRYVLSSILLSGAIAACDEGAPESEFTGPGIAIEVAPLTLPGISDACYDILVENSAPDGVAAAANNVVFLDNICSTTYGNGAGGDITYIAPCDASVTVDLDAGPTGASGVQNAAVTLWVASVTPSAGFVNPCPDTGPGCRIFTTCSPNADTFVEFNLTVMRDAQQGFFDVAVNFEDIFCSGKLDSRYSVNNPIMLLHGTDGQRDHTAVSALACTQGASNTIATTLFRNNANVQCSTTDCATFTTAGTCTPVSGCTWGGSACTGTANPAVPTANFVLDLALAEGNQEANNTLNGAGQTLRYAIYKGSEQLQVEGGTNAQKKYWNYAINLGELAEDYPTSTCRLAEHRATAVAVATCASRSSQATCTNGCVWNSGTSSCSGNAIGDFPAFAGGVYTSWPFVIIGGGTPAMVLTTARTGATGPGTVDSFQHQLNATNSKVTTTYVNSDANAGTGYTPL